MHTPATGDIGFLSNNNANSSSESVGVVIRVLLYVRKKRKIRAIRGTGDTEIFDTTESKNRSNPPEPLLSNNDCPFI